MSNTNQRLTVLEARQAPAINFSNTPYFRVSDYYTPDHPKYTTNRTTERAGALTDKTNNLVPISIITGTKDIGGVL